MNRKFEITPSKTYASESNCDKAVAKNGFENIRHFNVITAEGRFFPVFVGQEATQAGVHFHFNVVG